MSDPVAKIEIEDVLSSIRRLVSDGDKALTRDSAPAVLGHEDVDRARQANQPDTQANSTAATDTSTTDTSARLVLTPAFLVQDESDTPRSDDLNDHVKEPEQEQAAHIEADQDETWQEEDWPEKPSKDQQAAESADRDADMNEGGVNEGNVDKDDAPFRLTDMVWESVEDAKRIAAAKVAAEAKLAEAHDAVRASVAPPKTDLHVATAPQTPPERSDLVATIAELEAAFSSDQDHYEPDGSEVVDDAMTWPVAPPEAAPSFRARGSGAVEADVVDEDQSVDLDDAPAGAPAFSHRGPETSAPESSTDAQTSETSFADEMDDDLDDLMDAGKVAIDEDALRDMVAEVVRKELQGPMGERITRNVRKLVRREIYRILSSQEFD